MERLLELLGNAVQFAYTCWDRIVLNGYIERLQRPENLILMVVASTVYAAVLVAAVLVRSAAVSLIVLVPAGIAWVAALSSVNAELQLFLPAWVRGRGLSSTRRSCLARRRWVPRSPDSSPDPSVLWGGQ